MMHAARRPVGVALLVALAGGGCRTAPRESPAGGMAARVTLVDPHRHAVDVSQSWVTETPNEGFALVRVPGLPADSELDERASSLEGSFQAFATCEPVCRVLVRSVPRGEVYELQGPTFTDQRPFSGLVWLASDILVFDQWTQPHYGIHYAVDVRARGLLQAAPFTDRVDGQ
ncbi:hypothetical protein JQX13_15895 [Archangium violaceum]|uniref:hypothetical protein n=1 Tax=Archangium violaceum TaxID=83451 RepID=UPI00193C5C66|nr:hypothetical protein [Archangium violaceum]QRK11420.1 hypothetical protein JQX13_15895 [Archangium violaceum]